MHNTGMQGVGLGCRTNRGGGVSRAVIGRVARACESSEATITFTSDTPQAYRRRWLFRSRPCCWSCRGNEGLSVHVQHCAGASPQVSRRCAEAVSAVNDSHLPHLPPPLAFSVSNSPAEAKKFEIRHQTLSLEGSRNPLFYFPHPFYDSHPTILHGLPIPGQLRVQSHARQCGAGACPGSRQTADAATGVFGHASSAL